MDPDDPMFLPFAHEMDLAEMDLDVFRLEAAQFGAPKAGVDEAADDKFKLSMEPVAVLCHPLEEGLQLIGIEASRDP